MSNVTTAVNQKSLITNLGSTNVSVNLIDAKGSIETFILIANGNFIINDGKLVYLSVEYDDTEVEVTKLDNHLRFFFTPSSPEKIQIPIFLYSNCISQVGAVISTPYDTIIYSFYLHDVNSISNLYIHCVPQSPGADMKFSLISTACASGEPFYTHTDTNLINIPTIALNESIFVDVKDDLCTLSKGDYLNLKIVYSASALASFFKCPGCFMVYN